MFFFKERSFFLGTGQRGMRQGGNSMAKKGGRGGASLAGRLYHIPLIYTTRVNPWLYTQDICIKPPLCSPSLFSVTYVQHGHLHPLFYLRYWRMHTMWSIRLCRRSFFYEHKLWSDQVTGRFAAFTDIDTSNAPAFVSKWMSQGVRYSLHTLKKSKKMLLLLLLPQYQSAYVAIWT